VGGASNRTTRPEATTGSPSAGRRRGLPAAPTRNQNVPPHPYRVKSFLGRRSLPRSGRRLQRGPRQHARDREHGPPGTAVATSIAGSSNAGTGRGGKRSSTTW